MGEALPDNPVAYEPQGQPKRAHIAPPCHVIRIGALLLAPVPVRAAGHPPDAALRQSADAASACARLRPDWDGVPVSAASEAWILFLSPAGVALLVATLLALRFRSQLGGLVVVLGWTALVSVLTLLDPGGLRAAAEGLGCVGSPALFIALVIAICGAMILQTAPRANEAPTEKDK